MVYQRIRTFDAGAIRRRQGSADSMTTDKTASNSRIVLGDPVPWFDTPLVTGGAFDLHVSAGRWVMLSFLGFPQGHAQTVASVLRGLPSVDDSAGVPLFAPALIVPRVFSFELCDFLMQYYQDMGSAESGFQIDVGGKTRTQVDFRLKRRSDVGVVVPEVRTLVRDHVVRRLVPEIERHFQFKATRMDRYIVACYDAEVGGHFHRHRDNVNAGARHRRFALSVNLNNDFEGGNLIFPEFGRRTYRPPVGGALVFSCGALHQVLPVTRGRRFAFLAFLYGEDDARERKTNNARLHDGEQQYLGDQDRLFPEQAPAPQLAPV